MFLLKWQQTIEEKHKGTDGIISIYLAKTLAKNNNNFSWAKQDRVREQGSKRRKANTAAFFQLLMFFEQKRGDMGGKCFEFILGVGKGNA